MKVKMIEARAIKNLVRQGKTIDEMVEILGVSEEVLWSYIDRYKITLRFSSDVRPQTRIEKLLCDVLDFIHDHDMDGARFTLPPMDSSHRLKIDDEKIELENTNGYKMIYDRIRKTFVYFKMRGDSLEEELRYLLETLKQANENFIREAANA